MSTNLKNVFRVSIFEKDNVLNSGFTIFSMSLQWVAPLMTFHQVSKQPNIKTFQSASKSVPNPIQMQNSVIFLQNFGNKVYMLGQAVFLFHLDLLQFLPNIQYLHIFPLHFNMMASGEDEGGLKDRMGERAIFLGQDSPK